MISVIVPVYNVEKYLARCINSILAQSYREFELLLIDDGSTDSSGITCDQYIGKDERVRVFHKENGGLSDARNYGLDRMQGSYVTFVDSDDYIGPDCLKKLHEMAVYQGMDITAVSMHDTYSTGEDFVLSDDRRAAYSRNEAYREMLAGKGIGVMACGKLFKAQLFDGIRFPKGKVYEDLATVPFVIGRCDTCATSTSKEYYYFQRADSLSNSVSAHSVEDWVEIMEKILNYTMKEFPELYSYAETRLVKTTFWWIMDRMLQSKDYLGTAKRIKDIWGEHFKKVWRLPNLTFKERVKVSIFMISIRLFKAVRKPMMQMKALSRTAE